MSIGVLIVAGFGWILGMAILTILFYAHGERL